MFLRESLIMLALGTIVGLPAGILIARLASTILYGLSPADPLTAVLTIAALTMVTMAASYIPARRAARTDPMIALRGE